MNAIKFIRNRLFYLDQTQLPLSQIWKECNSLEGGYNAIRRLEVRGAPLIGVFAAYCVAITAQNLPDDKYFFKRLKSAITRLKYCRPTAVNLFWALERLENIILKNSNFQPCHIKRAILEEAKNIHHQDILLCERMGDYGVKLIKKGDRILTHCNTGFLAASGEGTALSAIYKAYKLYKDLHVYIDETRPLLQGARLTAWELTKRKIPCTLICDNTAAYLMQKGKIDKVFVGADRITANGDVANKIGTYNVAVVANYHKVPLYVVAPFSSFDLKVKNGSRIIIEQREEEEVKKVLGKIYIAPKSVHSFNPAFDITPQHLITAIVSDKGIIYPPYETNIKNLFRDLKLKIRCRLKN